jgi:phosphatidylethanolamine/phosphatidyl-N-methylethanolamine N-methyltransferase
MRMNRLRRDTSSRDRLKEFGALFSDEVRFLRTWASRPLTTGAVTSSGRALARAMAAGIDPAWPGAIVELGPGTGAVTAALLERGVSPERLIAIEYNADFATRLSTRFPGVHVVRGDAYALGQTLTTAGISEVAAVVSSLPLLTRPPEQRRALVAEVMDLIPAGRPLVQFSYAFSPPVPAETGLWTVDASDWIWINLPPARVWSYRRPGPA